MNPYLNENNEPNETLLDTLDYYGISLNEFKRMSSTKLSEMVKRYNNVLDTGEITRGEGINKLASGIFGSPTTYDGIRESLITDEGDFSRYFSLESWFDEKMKELPKEQRRTFPFLIEPKADKGSRNEGIQSLINLEVYNINYDDTWTEKSLTNEERLVLLSVDMGTFPLKATSESGTQVKDGNVWNTMLFGKEPTARYQQAYKSIIKTETNLTTQSKTLNWLTLLLTNGNTADARRLREYGINLVGTADKSTKYLITTREKVVSALGVVPAVSKTHVLIKLSVGRNIHPSCKPISLMSYLITLTTKPREIVLDPFMGSGTTAIAAHMMNRQFIGFEKEPDYHRIATERIAHYLKQCKLGVILD